MRTYLIEGVQTAQFDEDLLVEISLLERQEPRDDSNKGSPIAVENEEGDLYRIVEIANLIARKNFIDRLGKAGFWFDPLSPSAPNSFHGIIKFGTQ